MSGIIEPLHRSRRANTARYVFTLSVGRQYSFTRFPIDVGGAFQIRTLHFVKSTRVSRVWRVRLMPSYFPCLRVFLPRCVRAFSVRVMPDFVPTTLCEAQRIFLSFSHLPAGVLPIIAIAPQPTTPRSLSAF